MIEKKWKKLFFLLLGLNVVIILLFFIMINLPSGDVPNFSEDIEDGQYAPLSIQTNKANLNQIINHYLDKEGLSSTFDYHIMLDDAVELSGSIPVFSQNVQLNLTFEPKALENGDLILQQKSISVGQLQLPVPFVLKLIHDHYKLPKWVYIQPNEENIYVSLQSMKLKSDVKVKVDKFNLQEDDIRFTLMVPIK